MDTGVLILRSKFISSLSPEIATRTLKLDVTAAVGVPLRTPAVDSDKPAGRVPESRVQVRVAAPPPVAVNVRE
jgi:hypothetical protein